jgi:hypothetical protein
LSLLVIMVVTTGTVTSRQIRAALDLDNPPGIRPLLLTLYADCFGKEAIYDVPHEPGLKRALEVMMMTWTMTRRGGGGGKSSEGGSCRWC